MKSSVLMTLALSATLTISCFGQIAEPPSKCVDPRGCFPDSGSTRPVVDNSVQIRLAQVNNRFKAILDGLRPFADSNARDAFDGSPAANVVDLERRVDRAFGVAGLQEQRLARISEQNRKDLASYPNQIGIMENALSGLESSLASARSGALIANSESARLVSLAEAEERRSAQLWNRGEQASGRLRAMQFATADAIASLMLDPKDRDAFLDAFNTTFRSSSSFAAMSARIVAARAVPQPQIAAARGVAVPLPPGPPAPPPGTVESKLEALDKIATSISSLVPAIATQQARLAPLEKRFIDLRDRTSNTQDQLATQQAAIRASNEQAQDSRDRAEFAKTNQRRYATDALTFAASATVWNHYRVTVVMPEIEKFLRETGLLKGMPVADAVRRIAANPAELIPTKGRLKEWQRMSDVQRKVLELPQHFIEVATASIEANSDPNAASYSALLGNEIYAGLDRDGMNIMNTAAGSMQSPLGRVVRKWVKTAPTP